MAIVPNKAQYGRIDKPLTSFFHMDATSVVALPGGGKPNAPMVKSANVLISAAATLDDSILLPYPYSGAMILLKNFGPATARVFSEGTSIINGGASGTQIGNGNLALCRCYTDGEWIMDFLA